MRKIKEDDVRRLLQLISDARGYINYHFQEAKDAALLRIDGIEKQLYRTLGEEPPKHKDCYHTCSVHKDVPAK